MASTRLTHLQRALNIAKESTCRNKHGVVLAKGAKVLAVAVNTHRNAPQCVSDPKTESSYHAEINALKQLYSLHTDWTKITLYSARIGTLGSAMPAKPCEHCTEKIRALGIKAVYFT